MVSDENSRDNQASADSASKWKRFVSDDKVQSSHATDLPRQAFDWLRVSQPSESAAYDHERAHALRGKILGALIRRGRLAAQCDADDCALSLKIQADYIEAWELGQCAPSLPQLESLSRFFQAPDSVAALDDEYARIRQSLIGALLQSARLSKALSLEDMSVMTGLAADLLRRYEFGETQLPAHHLIALAHALDRDLDFFADLMPAKGAAPQTQVPHAVVEPAADDRLTQFTADQRNHAFIRLAMAFRDMERDALDRVASALLAIIRDSQEATNPSQS